MSTSPNSLQMFMQRLLGIASDPAVQQQVLSDIEMHLNRLHQTVGEIKATSPEDTAAAHEAIGMFGGVKSFNTKLDQILAAFAESKEWRIADIKNQETMMKTLQDVEQMLASNKSEITNLQSGMVTLTNYCQSLLEQNKAANEQNKASAEKIDALTTRLEQADADRTELQQHLASKQEDYTAIFTELERSKNDAAAARAQVDRINQVLHGELKAA